MHRYVPDMSLASSPKPRKTKKPESEYDLGDEDDDELEEEGTYNDVDDSTFTQPSFGVSPSSKHGLVGSVGLPGKTVGII